MMIVQRFMARILLFLAEAQVVIWPLGGKDVSSTINTVLWGPTECREPEGPMERITIQEDEASEAPDESDEGLLLTARDGSMRAFETLVKRYEMPLFRFCRRMLQNADDADDAFQETFLRVYRHMDRFQAGSRFRPWVYHIAANLCRDTLRKRKRQLRREAKSNPKGNAEVETVESTAAGPRDEAIASETAERLEAAIARLHPKHRAVFLMARYEGLPYSEIAHALRLPMGTVKSRMNKAVSELLSDLQEESQ